MTLKHKSVLLIAALSLPVLAPTMIRAQPSDESGESYYFLVPDSETGGDNEVLVFDVEQDRILKSTVSPDDLNCFSRGWRQSVHSGKWVVLPQEVFALKAPSLQAARADIRLSYPEELKATSRSIITSDHGVRFVEFSYSGAHYYIPAALVVGKSDQSIEELMATPIGCELVDLDNPLPLDYVPADLVRVNQRWNFHGASYPKYLRAEAAEMLNMMLSEAERQRIHLRVFSAYRSSKKQRFLYLQEISRSGLQQRSVAKPGHSEHQLGTAVDLCGLDPETVASSEFGETRMGVWLTDNAVRFGFRQTYTKENTRAAGYIPEPWHFRYLGRD